MSKAYVSANNSTSNIKEVKRVLSGGAYAPPHTDPLMSNHYQKQGKFIIENQILSGKQQQIQSQRQIAS